MEAFRLDGQVALITGGGTGLGLAIAECMIEAGAKVMIVGRTEPALRAAAERLGPSCAVEVFDVTRHDEGPRLLEKIEQRLGAVSILVNNAGVHLKKPALETSDEEFLRVLDTHLLSAFSLARSCAPRMIAAGHGSIVFIASMSSTLGVPRVVAYTAAKTATVGVVRALAADWSPQGIRVNAIAPGWIETPMLRQAFAGDPERERRVLQRTPLQRLGTPRDVGYAAVYLSSPAARFLTGSVLTVDGGASIGF